MLKILRHDFIQGSKRAGAAEDARIRKAAKNEDNSEQLAATTRDDAAPSLKSGRPAPQKRNAAPLHCAGDDSSKHPAATSTAAPPPDGSAVSPHRFRERFHKVLGVVQPGVNPKAAARNACAASEPAQSPPGALAERAPANGATDRARQQLADMQAGWPMPYCPPTPDTAPQPSSALDDAADPLQCNAVHPAEPAIAGDVDWPADSCDTVAADSLSLGPLPVVEAGARQDRAAAVVTPEAAASPHRSTFSGTVKNTSGTPSSGVALSARGSAGSGALATPVPFKGFDAAAAARSAFDRSAGAQHHATTPAEQAVAAIALQRVQCAVPVSDAGAPPLSCAAAPIPSGGPSVSGGSGVAPSPIPDTPESTSQQAVAARMCIDAAVAQADAAGEHANAGAAQPAYAVSEGGAACAPAADLPDHKLVEPQVPHAQQQARPLADCHAGADGSSSLNTASAKRRRRRHAVLDPAFELSEEPATAPDDSVMAEAAGEAVAGSLHRETGRVEPAGAQQGLIEPAAARPSDTHLDSHAEGAVARAAVPASAGQPNQPRWQGHRSQGSWEKRNNGGVDDGNIPAAIAPVATLRAADAPGAQPGIMEPATAGATEHGKASEHPQPPSPSWTPVVRSRKRLSSTGGEVRSEHGTPFSVLASDVRRKLEAFVQPAVARVLRSKCVCSASFLLKTPRSPMLVGAGDAGTGFELLVLSIIIYLLSIILHAAPLSEDT